MGSVDPPVLVIDNLLSPAELQRLAKEKFLDSRNFQHPRIGWRNAGGTIRGEDHNARAGFHDAESSASSSSAFTWRCHDVNDELYVNRRRAPGCFEFHALQDFRDRIHSALG